MKKSLGIAFTLMACMSLAWASISLNSSRSNVYRVTYHTGAVSPTQAAAVLKELDKIGPGANEAVVKKILQQQGVNLSLIKQVRIVPAGQRREKIPLVLILMDPKDGPAAIAVSDPGTPSDKPSKPTTH